MTQPTLPRFVLGFAFLQQQLGAVMGSPVENEHGTPQNCDLQQQTTTGLAYWRCATGTLSFLGAPDGQQHWAWVSGQLIQWSGPSPDPPAALPVAPTTPNCLEPNDRPESACMLLDGVSLPGYLRAPDDLRAYRVDLQGAQTHLLASLTDLPADYDLYLADAGGSLLAQSVQEGLAPEFVDVSLPSGTYFLYVHVDPARDFDAQDPFWLHLSLTAPLATPDDIGQTAPGPAG